MSDGRLYQGALVEANRRIAELERRMANVQQRGRRSYPQSYLRQRREGNARARSEWSRDPNRDGRQGANRGL